MTEADRFRELDRLFQLVCDLPCDERNARLIELAPDDESLRSEVIDLLASEGDPLSGLSPEALQADIGRVLARSAADPETIGGYRIIRRLGAGGMGVVYEAQQTSPQRTVALKVLRPGLATPDLIRRFTFEAEALGRLHHPGIAHIYEAGVADSPSGLQPFFAMELIEGEQLNAWAKSTNATTRQRLEVFAKICDAIQHAHSQGVIHRDIKPANILITNSGIPKVLDFGVARTVDSTKGLQTLQTEQGQLVGTMPYMSPEQLAGNTDDVDTRSDVFGLGVVLYELLSGALPNTIDGLGIVEAAEVIRERNAAKLSTFDTKYRGDIETIAATAIAKAKGDRYQTVAAFADDVRRYLAGETIAARPPSAVYQFSRFAQRNRLLVGSSVAIVLAMALGVTGTSVGLSIAKRQTRLAEERLIESNRQVKITTAVTSFLNNDVLAAIVPGAQGHDVTVREALDAAAHTLNERFENEPETRAAISNNIGNIYFTLGEFALAEPLIRQAVEIFSNELGPIHEMTLAAENDLGLLLRDTGHYEEAETILNSALNRTTGEFGPTDTLSLKSLITSAELAGSMGEYARASELLDQFEQRRQGVLPDDDSSVIFALMTSATLDLKLGHPEKAESAYRRVYTSRLATEGPAHPRTLIAAHNLATSLEALERFEDALPLYQYVYETELQTSGPDNPDILVTAHNLAFLYMSMERYDEAEPLMQDTLNRCRKVFGETHPGTLTCTGSMASLLRDTGRLAEAEKLLRAAYTTASDSVSQDSPTMVDLSAQLAGVLAELGNTDEAELYFVSALTGQREMLPTGHPEIGSTLSSWGKSRVKAGHDVTAESMFLEAYEIFIAVGDVKSATETAGCLAALYERLGEHDETEIWSQRVLADPVE